MKFFELEVISNGPLSLSIRGDGFPRDCHLDLHGKPIYLIGTTCSTCVALFRRLQNADPPLAPDDLSDILRNGLQTIPQNIVETVKLLLPQGKFIVALLPTIPSRSPSNFYRQNVPNPLREYFWERQLKRNEHELKTEIILPIFPENRLNTKRVKFYQDRIKSGQTPTALAFSLVDVRVPMGGHLYDWTLAHFLLDGHHKVMAASQLNKPITILSFLLVKNDFFSADLKDETIEQLYGRI